MAVNKGETYSLCEQHPSLEGIQISRFEGGSSNYTYEAESQFIHVKVSPLDLSERHQRVIGNFYHQSKAARIAHSVDRAPSHEGVVIPRILSWSDWESQDMAVSTWVDENLRENYEVSSYMKLGLDNYLDLVEWAASLHAQSAITNKSTSEHYTDRGEAFMDLLFDDYSAFGDTHRAELQEVIQSYFDLTNSSVTPNEITTAIHGDLRGGNLLALQENGKLFTGIVDFEHGINGGDRMVDIAKLLQLEHMFRPPAKIERYMYAPQITMIDKSNLIRHYLDSAEQQAEALPSWMSVEALSTVEGGRLLDRRHLLITLDNILMVLILRLHEEQNNWLETELNPQFILGLLKECRDKSNELN